MKNFAPLFGLLLSAACATAPIKVPSRPDLPDRIATQEEAAKLAEAYKLVCADSKCTRSDGSYDLDASSVLATGYGEPTQVLNDASFTNTGIGVGIIFTSMFASLSSLWWTSAMTTYVYDDHSRQEQQQYQGMSAMMGVAGAITGATTLIIWALASSPDEDFAAAYNKALERDLASRVKPEPAQVAQAH